MCGIAGFWDREQSWGDHRARLERAHRAIAHRGPDASSIWTSQHSQVGFAHRRLAIIDLNERSTQPMVSRSRDSVITFNGEVYNYQALQKKFTGFVWRTTSDTEVMLEALEISSEGAIDSFDGMFAFAHFSQSKNEMLLAVDPFGKKPLYTFWNGHVFAFASEIKALKAMGVPLEVEADALSEYFLFGASFGDGTVFKNVRRLEGGTYLKIVNGVPQKVSKYWDLPLGQIQAPSNDDSVYSELQSLIHAAVQKRMIADVPIGCFLSGGLDSSVVAFEAQAHRQGAPLQTFSVGFPENTEFDETRYAEQVARKIGSHHQSLNGTPPDRKKIGEILAHFDEPFPDSSCLPTFALCESVRTHVTVALSGDGGDELFGGYRRMQAALFTERWGGLMQTFLKPLGSLNLKASSPRSKLGFLLRLQSALHHPFSRRLMMWNSYFPEEALKKHLNVRFEAIDQTLTEWDERLQGHDTGQKIFYLNAKTYLFSDLLPKVDRMSMYHSLEVRSPLLDKALAEFTFRLPTAYKLTPRMTKRVLKDIYRAHLGRDIVDRKKQGFATPLNRIIQDWSKSQSREWADDRLTRYGHFEDLMRSQAGSANYETCVFAMWAFIATLANKGDHA
jgi:asparagine synthase (glutamine-hydrolysing)